MKWKDIPDSKEKRLFVAFFWQDYRDWKLIVSEVCGLSIEEMVKTIQETEEYFGYEDLIGERSYEEIAQSVQKWAHSLAARVGKEEREMTDKQREQNKRIGELTDSQAKIALRAIASGKSLDEALDIAETY